MRDTASPSAVNENQRFAARSNNAAILVVEDNAINAEIARAFLEQIGCTVVMAENGAVAVDLANSHDFAAILMDIQMPVMDGLEATRRIRRGPVPKGSMATPIIALTAYASHADLHACLNAGMNDFLTKPLDMTKLFETLAKWDVVEHGIANAPVAATPNTVTFDRVRFDALVKTIPAERRDSLIAMSIQQINHHRTLIANAKPGAQDIRQTVHNLISVSGNLGLIHLSDLSRCMENRMRDGDDPDTPDIRALLAVIDQSLDQIRNVIPEITRVAS